MLDPVQIGLFNAISNIVSLFGLVIIAGIVWGYKRRVQKRYDGINKRLDNILLLTHEVYQSDRDKKQEANLEIIPGAVSPKESSGSELRTIHTLSI